MSLFLASHVQLLPKYAQNVTKTFRLLKMIVLLVPEPRSDTPRSSGWVRWKADNFLLNLKKSGEKYVFIMEKFDFEKI